MARPRIEWSDSQLRLIMSGIEECDRRFPDDNARFLDAVIDEIAVVTGKLYGVGTYARLLRGTGESTGVARRPSNSTIQAAIKRAGTTPPASQASADPIPDIHSLRRIVEPVVRDALAPLHEMLAQFVNNSPAAGAAAAAPTGGEQSLLLELTQASLTDAHARTRSLEDENARLRRKLTQTETQASIAETRIVQLLEELNRTIADSAAGADALTQAAKRLEGTERFLKAQNDAVRLQATTEADGLRRIVEQLRDQIGHLQIECDQYRRLLSAQRGSSVGG